MTKSTIGRRDFLKGMLAVGVVAASGVAVQKIAEARQIAIGSTAIKGDILPARPEMSLSELDRAIMWTPDSPNRMVIHYGGDIYVTGDYSNNGGFPTWKRLPQRTLNLL